MYESFYGFTEKPFSLQPDPAFLYLGKKHRMALTMLEYGLMNRAAITVITGEIGSGKTTLLRHLLTKTEEDYSIGLISNTHRAFGELLQWVCLAYGLPYEGRDKVALYNTFVEFLISEYSKGRRTVLIVDEAQNLDSNTLEEVRVLSNINADKDQVLQLVLVGQPELRDTFSRPDMEQLSQRVAVSYHLGALEPEETDEYVRHRIRLVGGNDELFEPQATRFIHHQTGGTPRLINKLCDMTLVYGFAEERTTIDVKLVYDVVREQSRAGVSFSVRHKDSASQID